MILGEDQKPSITELAHFGVRGMKWGVRKSQPETSNAGYSVELRRKHRRQYDDKTVRRINRRLNNGESLASAHQKEAQRFDRRQAFKTYARFGSRFAITVLAINGPRLLQSAYVSQMARKGAQFTANSFADGYGLGPAPSVIRPNFRGVYNVTSM